MKILGIETSCDETAASVVEDGHLVLSNVIASQIDLHAKTGGVVPEVAAREHVLKMLPVIDEALGNFGFDDLDAIAVTKGPGLISSLIIGTETASVISCVKEIRLIEVQHIVGHIYSNWLNVAEPIEFPILVLTVSGGHNELILMKGHGEFEVLGETLDDAAGEAFDKVARLLDLGYPGGPIISRIAVSGDEKAFKLPRAWLSQGSLDFSFSGLKTAVLDLVKNTVAARGILSAKFKADVSASFQEAVCEILATKLMMAYEKFPQIKELHLAGGVSANLRLRELIEEKIAIFKIKVKFRYPRDLKFCTDNAAMIAAAGYHLYKKNPKAHKRLANVVPSANYAL
ncbi:tRNA (adenosine(37)-N6)-threonylcarbamoyltransferase complex transferase subunit TsaD [Candidatus Peregrinibacteria bacterium]|nr:tRNA (adenosine(37)-N6)-threonylcarbamoyltransferase complex transferase subunit TsaD [Candidatus Peregrinibacteria bacterium]